jgi:hypothetical protein
MYHLLIYLFIYLNRNSWALLHSRYAHVDKSQYNCRLGRIPLEFSRPAGKRAHNSSMACTSREVSRIVSIFPGIFRVRCDIVRLGRRVVRSPFPAGGVPRISWEERYRE